MIWNKLSLTAGFGLALLIPQLPAQDDEYKRLTFNVGGGYTGTVGQSSGRLDRGGHLQVGAGFNFNQYLGILGTFQLHQTGVTGSALRLADQPDGRSHIYNVTVDPVVRFRVGGRTRAYFLAGGGWLRRTVDFTKPTLAQTVVFDPWWGYFGPAVIPVNQILGSYTSDAGAWDAGGGLDVPLGNRSAKVYVEARYIRAFTAGTDTEIVPITVGFRW
jgi:hypothetical protein